MKTQIGLLLLMLSIAVGCDDSSESGETSKQADYRMFTQSQNSAQITDDQAFFLGKQSVVVLDSLTFLTDEQAECFGELKELHLNSLASITDRQAEVFSNIETLSLDGLSTISETQAIHLTRRSLDGSRSQGGRLSLGGLISFTNETLIILANAGVADIEEQFMLFTNGLLEVTDNQLEKFSKLETLHLNSIVTMTDQQMAILCKGRESLQLNGLEAISDKQAESLKNVPFLSLNGLKVLTDKQADRLGERKKFSFFKVNSLSLNKLSQINENQAKSLGSTEYLYLDGLKSITNIEALGLGSVCCILSLNGLKSITTKQAEYLSSVQQELYLNGITDLNDQQVEVLSQSEAKMSLNGFLSINDYQAKMLGRLEQISLAGLREVTDDQVASLSNSLTSFGNNHLYKHLTLGITNVSDKQAEIFSRISHLRLDNLTTLNGVQARNLRRVKNLEIPEGLRAVLQRADR
jgi:hypothetical protein